MLTYQNKILKTAQGNLIFYPPILDIYEGFIGYSMKLIKTSYTGPCCRVRRSSDNTEADIGFYRGWLDETALLNHCGNSNGFITKWYDQCENYDAIQNVASYQPKIVSSGVVEKENGKPAWRYVSNQTWMSTTAFSSPLSQPLTISVVAKKLNPTSVVWYYSNIEPNWSRLSLTWEYGGEVSYVQLTAPDIALALVDASNLTKHFLAVYNSSTSFLAIDGIPFDFYPEFINTGTNSLEGLTIGNVWTGLDSGYPVHAMQELIVFNSNLSSEYSFITRDINYWFSIY